MHKIILNLIFNLGMRFNFLPSLSLSLSLIAFLPSILHFYIDPSLGINMKASNMETWITNKSYSYLWTTDVWIAEYIILFGRLSNQQANIRYWSLFEKWQCFQDKQRAYSISIWLERKQQENPTLTTNTVFLVFLDKTRLFDAVIFEIVINNKW